MCTPALAAKAYWMGWHGMLMPARARLDQLLFDRGLAESREKAQALILAGSVFVNGQRADKAGTKIAIESQIDVQQSGLPYVGRGGFKLEAALREFDIDPRGRVCADIGSSTGGFTDCLLQQGAARVHCIDVGKGQLHWKLRNDSRVVLHEGVNARYLTPETVGERVSIAVCDVSFISVTLILPVIPPLLEADADAVILIKPQFEVGRNQVGKGGIVRDAALHQMVCGKVENAARLLGWTTRIIDSPILGAEGNKEFLLHGRQHSNSRADHQA